MPTHETGLQPFATFPAVAWAVGPGWYGPRRWRGDKKRKCLRRLWKPTRPGVGAPSERKGSNATDATEAGLGAWYRWRRCCADPHPWPSLPGRSRGSEGGSPSPRPSPPREGETLAAFVEKDAPRCWRAFLSEGQQRDGRNRGHRAFKQRPEVLPLLGGEGRGEGEPPSDPLLLWGPAYGLPTNWFDRFD